MQYYLIKTNVNIASWKSDLSVRKLRGVVLKAFPKGNDLWSNHQGWNGPLLPGYSKVQYKIIDKVFCIVVLSPAFKGLLKLMKKTPISGKFKKRKIQLDILTIEKHHQLIQLEKKLSTFQCNNWLPFNSLLYTKFLKLYKKRIGDPLQEQSFGDAKINQLLLATLREYFLDALDDLQVDIDATQLLLSLDSSQLKAKLVPFHDHTPYMMFKYLRFSTNLSWPVHWSIGHGTAFGFGVLKIETHEST